jgi:hypothetical protein
VTNPGGRKIKRPAIKSNGLEMGRNGKMKARKKPVEQKAFLLPTLAEQLNARRPIYQLAGKIPWRNHANQSILFTTHPSFKS